VNRCPLVLDWVGEEDPVYAGWSRGSCVEDAPGAEHVKDGRCSECGIGWN
jgi:hypothetical protein